MKGFGQITRKYLGRPFDECNCLQLLYHILIDMGVAVPNEYKGHTLETYLKHWKENPTEATRDLIGLFGTLGRKVDINFLESGDIIIVKYKDSKFPSIYLGGNIVMAATQEDGVITIPIGKSFRVVMARRLI